MEPDTASPEAIEITPAMLAAGSEVMERYYLGDGRYAVTNDGLAEIFRAMVREANLEPAALKTRTHP